MEKKEEKNKDSLKVYRYEVTGLRDNGDKTYGPERQAVRHGYAVSGDLMPCVDYGDYFSLGGGSLNLTAKSGDFLDHVEEMIADLMDDGFSESVVRVMIDDLDESGKWAEVSLGTKEKLRLRITRLSELPEIDPVQTVENSDLSVMQQHSIKINGVPLFKDGESIRGVGAGTTTVLRTDIGNFINGVYERFIEVQTGKRVVVSVDHGHVIADSITRRMTVAAKSRADLDAALCALGVLNPGEIDADLTYGEVDGGGATRFVTTVTFTDNID